MSYKNTKAFNQSLAGKAAGQCLANVRKGFGVGSKYASAWQAWLHTDQHTDPIPTGVDVPVYFSYDGPNNGHIGVQLANGKFWSDGETYASIGTFEAGHFPRYVGWSTSVDGVAVLQQSTEAQTTLPPIGSEIHLAKGIERTTYKVGTATVAGHIIVKDDTYDYTVRGYDAKYPGSIIINTASGGGNGVRLALYYLAGGRIDGWTQI